MSLNRFWRTSSPPALPWHPPHDPHPSRPSLYSHGSRGVVGCCGGGAESCIIGERIGWKRLISAGFEGKRVARKSVHRRLLAVPDLFRRTPNEESATISVTPTLCRLLAVMALLCGMLVGMMAWVAVR